jgi:hypothetical protein
MKRKISPSLDLAERAKFYGVCERTVRRWHQQGADLRNPESIADLLLRMRNPSPRALKITHSLIQ